MKVLHTILAGPKSLPIEGSRSFAFDPECLPREDYCIDTKYCITVLLSSNKMADRSVHVLCNIALYHFAGNVVWWHGPAGSR
jgi:hypothetical protein